MRKLLLLLAVIMAAYPAAGQGLRSLRGVVTDSAGEPLPGAAVLIKDSGNGVITDLDGAYVIEVSDGTDLEFSFIGFETQEVRVQGQQSLDVRLSPLTTYLEEAVVVGYGEQKKINLTGSVNQIKGESIANKPAVNVLAALQGELPGVVITQSSGQPGEEGLDLRIRGYSSVNSMESLVLIDGLEGGLNMLNPNDIASISVLKDAASASIYGSRAAAGVILVTTKQGESERVKVEYNGSYSFTRSGRKPSRLESWEEYIITQRANDKPINLEQIEWLKNPNLNYLLASKTSIGYYDNTDWIAESLNDWSSMQKHSVSAGGGNRKMNFNASVGYYNRRGFLKYGPDDNSRYNFRFNMFARASNFVDFSFKFTGGASEVNANAIGINALFGTIYRCRGNMPVYFPSDEDPVPCLDEYCGYGGSNPIDLMKNAGTNTTRNNDFSGQAYMRIRNLIKGLQLRLTASRSYRSQLGDKKSNRIIWHSRGEHEYRYSQTQPSYISRTRVDSYTDKLQSLLDYDLSSVKGHHLHAMAGTEWENYRYENVFAMKEYMTDGNYSLNFGEASSARNSDNIRTSATMSVFGRLNYDYREKYLLEANIRADGSSRLDPENRWGFFPSASGGWVISKENLIKDYLRWVDLLKLRASWGQLGNSTALGYYDYINIITSNSTSAIIGGSPATANYIATLASPSKTWEIVEIANAGFDFGFMKGKLSGSFEIYRKTNRNMLSSAMNVPSLIGVGLPSFNVGELNTKGWDFEIKWKDSIGRNFWWWFGVNVADTQNILTKYNGSNVINEGIVPLLEGYPLNTIWGYRTDGLFQETPSMAEALCQPGGALTAAGDVKYLNQDDDPYINGGDYTPDNPGDLVCLGSTDPRYTFGIQFGAEWKGLRFSAQLQGVGQRYFLLDDSTLNPTGGSLYQAISIHREYWTEENRDAFMPRPVFKGGAYNYKPADRWIQDAAYLRIKNVTLSYDIPKLRSRLIRAADIFISGDNLGELTKTWKEFDPEAPSLTSAENWYAFYRAITFGVHLTF